MLIGVNISALDSSLYEANRYTWRLSRMKASEAEVISATVRGVVVGAFVVEKWLEANTVTFPSKEAVEGRYGFNRYEAPLALQQQYIGKRIPDEFRRKGASNL